MVKAKQFIFSVLIVSFSVIAHSQETDSLYKTIVRMDSIFFHVYNTCDMATQASIYSDSIEFYHDTGGLTTSKEQLLESTRKNICGKVTRELVRGSIEVSPIPGYGAVEIGQHKFHNNEEKNAVPKASKFVVIWKNENGKWKMTRVISLHSN